MITNTLNIITAASQQRICFSGKKLKKQNMHNVYKRSAYLKIKKNCDTLISVIFLAMTLLNFNHLSYPKCMFEATVFSIRQ